MASPSLSSAPAALMGQLQPIRARIAAFAAQPAVRRARPALLAVLGLAVVWGAVTMLQSAAMQPLYPGLGDADKAAVVQALSASGIAYRIDPASGAVEVAQADYYGARMALAAKGLPESAPSAQAALDAISVGESHSVEAARLRMAQELDLSASIERIRTVTHARVHLALPEPSVFVSDSLPPRASVMVEIAEGRVLDPGQVEAIVDLVSAAVPGMPRSGVTVVDQFGHLLSQGNDNPVLEQGNQELSYRAKVEDLMRQRIAALVTPIVGPQNLSVEVSADIDFTRTDTTAETIDPRNNAVTSEHLTVSDSAQPDARGIPGAVSNTPPPAPAVTTAAPAASAASAGPTAHSEDTLRNYDTGKTVQTTSSPGARLARVSVAVLLRAGDPATAAARKTMVEDLVKGAVGFDAARGDSVTVSESPFVTEAAPPDLPWYRSISPQQILLVAAGVAGLVLALTGALRLLRRPKVAAPAPLPKPHPEPFGMSAAREQIAQVQTYDERLSVARRIVTDEAARVAGVFSAQMADDINMVK